MAAITMDCMSGLSDAEQEKRLKAFKKEIDAIESSRTPRAVSQRRSHRPLVAGLKSCDQFLFGSISAHETIVLRNELIQSSF